MSDTAVTTRSVDQRRKLPSELWAALAYAAALALLTCYVTGTSSGFLVEVDHIEYTSFEVSTLGHMLTIPIVVAWAYCGVRWIHCQTTDAASRASFHVMYVSGMVATAIAVHFLPSWTAVCDLALAFILLPSALGAICALFTVSRFGGVTSWFAVTFISSLALLWGIFPESLLHFVNSFFDNEMVMYTVPFLVALPIMLMMVIAAVASWKVMRISFPEALVACSLVVHAASYVVFLLLPEAIIILGLLPQATLVP